MLTSDDAARDQRAICLSLKPGLFQYVRDAKSAKEEWQKLTEVFEDGEYIEKVTSVVQQLSDIGKVIEDEEIAKILLSGLPQEYDTFGI
ncbi:gag-polypeptide of LTR copia-type domain-containing protein [Phthorimaea operculella]|nr:gag-polypeptide of LTR copia-type domain-containing protein [Phthorimaea operculella]